MAAPKFPVRKTRCAHILSRAGSIRIHYRSTIEQVVRACWKCGFRAGSTHRKMGFWRRLVSHFRLPA